MQEQFIVLYFSLLPRLIKEKDNEPNKVAELM